jgi:hypothetical protein
MTPRERYLAVLGGEMPDRVPFAIWNNKLPGEPVNSQLFELEACAINKSTVYQATTPGIEIETEQLEPIDNLPRRRKTFHTRAGILTTVERITPGSIWLEKMPFGGPDDYEPLEAFISGKVYTPCYDKFVADDTMYGEQSLARPETIYTPIQDLICKYMGVEAFCIEWADRRERLLKLCETIAEDRRKRLEIVAVSPARFVIIEGNIITEVTGPQRFEEHHIRYIEQACELLHKNGKYAGAHLDANNKALADLIGGTSLDLIESFTPPLRPGGSGRKRPSRYPFRPQSTSTAPKPCKKQPPIYSRMPHPATASLLGSPKMSPKAASTPSFPSPKRSTTTAKHRLLRIDPL